MQPQKKLSFSNNTKRELSFDVKSQDSNNQYDRRGGTVKQNKYKESRKKSRRESNEKGSELKLLEVLKKSKQKTTKQIGDLLSKLSKEEMDNYREAFANYDKNGDGTIDENELMYVMRSLGENPSEDQMAYIMHEMDTDANGVIDFEEFLIAMAERRLMYDSTEDLRKAFEVFDQNGDGTVSSEELRSTMAMANDLITIEEAEEIVRMADKNGDGVIDYNEFVLMMRS